MGYVPAHTPYWSLPQDQQSSDIKTRRTRREEMRNLSTHAFLPCIYCDCTPLKWACKNRFFSESRIVIKTDQFITNSLLIYDVSISFSFFKSWYFPRHLAQAFRRSGFFIKQLYKSFMLVVSPTCQFSWFLWLEHRVLYVFLLPILSRFHSCW